jgi:hypothetical protein
MVCQGHSQIDTHFIKGAQIIATELGAAKHSPPIQSTGFRESKKSLYLLQRNIAEAFFDQLVNWNRYRLAPRGNGKLHHFTSSRY